MALWHVHQLTNSHIFINFCFWKQKEHIHPPKKLVLKAKLLWVSLIVLQIAFDPNKNLNSQNILLNRQAVPQIALPQVPFHEVHCVHSVLTRKEHKSLQGSAVPNQTLLLCTYQILQLHFTGVLPLFIDRNHGLICSCSFQYIANMATTWGEECPVSTLNFFWQFQVCMRAEKPECILSVNTLMYSNRKCKCRSAWFETAIIYMVI